MEKSARADWESVRKRSIESGMSLDGNDTIPGHVPVQRTQMRSFRGYWVS